MTPSTCILTTRGSTGYFEAEALPGETHLVCDFTILSEDEDDIRDLTLTLFSIDGAGVPK
jgi:hypothetical protein